MRDLLNAEDWDGLISLAKEQEREGAHVLDVNVDFVGRDGERDMHALASRLVTNIKVPLMFDSTEWQKMEAGLQHAGGKSILNSTNYEDGEPRFAKVIELAKHYGASVVIGTIDEEGMARTAEVKFFQRPPEELLHDPRKEARRKEIGGAQEDRQNHKTRRRKDDEETGGEQSRAQESRRQAQDDKKAIDSEKENFAQERHGAQAEGQAEETASLRGTHARSRSDDHATRSG